MFDPTLIDPEECQYFGVQISDKDLWAQLRVIEHYGILDTHCGLNINFMLKVDEGMKQIIKNFRLNKYNFQL